MLHTAFRVCPHDRSGLQLVIVTDRPILSKFGLPGDGHDFVGVDEALDEAVEEGRSMCRSCLPDRSIGLLGTGAAEGGEEVVGPAADVVVVDLFA